MKYMKANICQEFFCPCPSSLLKKSCVVARMEERESPAEWAGQNSPGTNPSIPQRKAEKKGECSKRAKSQARSKEKPLPDSAKRPALPSRPGKALRSATGGRYFVWQKRQRFFHGLELQFCRFSKVGGILALSLWRLYRNCNIGRSEREGILSESSGRGSSMDGGGDLFAMRIALCA